MQMMELMIYDAGGGDWRVSEKTDLKMIVMDHYYYDDYDYDYDYYWKRVGVGLRWKEVDG